MLVLSNMVMILYGGIRVDCKAVEIVVVMALV